MTSARADWDGDGRNDAAVTKTVDRLKVFYILQPLKATLDVFHIAITTVHGIDFLLTLNCKHIANAFIYRRIREVCRDFGFEPPIVCTPQEILGKENKIDEG